MKTLTYTRISDSVLSINLHNGYTVIAIKGNDIDTLELMEKQDNIEFIADRKSINSVIIKHVATLLSEGFYNYYIERYDYMIKCFERGNELFEKERLNRNSGGVV